MYRPIDFSRLPRGQQADVALPASVDEKWTSERSINSIIDQVNVKWTSEENDSFICRADGAYTCKMNWKTRKFDHIVYYEVKVDSISAGGLLSVGFCWGEIPTPQNFLPGAIPSSCGFFSDGSSVGDKKAVKSFQRTPYGKPYGQGDVVGIGVGCDSFNQFFFFATLNGEYLGPLPSDTRNLNHVYPSPLYPYVGAEGSTEVQLHFDFAPPSSTLPQPMQDLFLAHDNSYLDQLPKEILNLILLEAATDRVALMNIPGVCKSWKLSDDFWKSHFFKCYPYQNKKLNVKNWKKFFHRREVAEGRERMRVHSGICRTASVIENCDRDSECPMIWQKLSLIPGVSQSEERHCDKCLRSVFKANSGEKVTEHIEQGHLVAFDYNPPRFSYQSSRSPATSPPPPKAQGPVRIIPILPIKK